MLCELTITPKQPAIRFFTRILDSPLCSDLSQARCIPPHFRREIGFEQPEHDVKQLHSFRCNAKGGRAVFKPAEPYLKGILHHAGCLLRLLHGGSRTEIPRSTRATLQSPQPSFTPSSSLYKPRCTPHRTNLPHPHSQAHSTSHSFSTITRTLKNEVRHRLPVRTSLRLLSPRYGYRGLRPFRPRNCHH